MARSTSAPWMWKCQRAAASREEESWSTRRTWNTWNRYGDASAAAQLLSDDTDQDVQFGSSVCIWFVCFLFVCLFISWQMEDSEGTVRQIGAFSDGINNLTVRHWAAPVQSDRSEWPQQTNVSHHLSLSLPLCVFQSMLKEDEFYHEVSVGPPEVDAAATENSGVWDALWKKSQTRFPPPPTNIWSRTF